MTTWQNTLADLQKVRQTEDQIRTDRYNEMNVLGQRLSDVFNSEVANTILPPIRSNTKQALLDVQNKAIEIAHEVHVGMLDNAYSHGDLQMLINAVKRGVSSKVGPGLSEILNPFMLGVGAPLLNTLKIAFKRTEEADEERYNAHKAIAKARETALFDTFLKEEGGSADIIRLLASGFVDHRELSAEKISEKLGVAVSDDDMKALSDTLSEILKESQIMPPIQKLPYPEKIEGSDEKRVVQHYEINGFIIRHCRAYFKTETPGGAPQP